MLHRILNTEKAHNLSLADQRKRRVAPDLRRTIPRQARRVLARQRHRRLLRTAALQRRKTIQPHPAHRVLDAVLAIRRPLKGHRHSVLVFHQHQRVDTIRTVIIAQKLQHSPEGIIQRVRRKHRRDAAQRQILLLLREALVRIQRIRSDQIAAFQRQTAALPFLRKNDHVLRRILAARTGPARLAQQRLIHRPLHRLQRHPHDHAQRPRVRL